MEPNIAHIPSKTLIGRKELMSFASDKTSLLWQSFMPRKREIPHQLGIELYSVEMYPDTHFFTQFDPQRIFEKWAAIEVSHIETVPEGMATLVIPEGLYAIFLYQGKGSEAAATYQYIFSSWIPLSDYQLDYRPHLAVMGEKYKNEDPNSEEELYIPVKLK